jgi:thiol-disulfide isomerase/thioredoxin
MVALIKSGGPSPEKIDLLMGFAEAIGDHGDDAPVNRLFKEVLPEFRSSKDPVVIEMLPILEGIARRLDLPGHKLELTGTYLDGKPLNWDSYRGKVVLIDFWATWCGPCRAEVPNVLENYRKYHEKGFDVLGISLDEERSAVEQYMKESGVPWRTTFYTAPDPQHKQPPMAIKYGVTGIPRCILVDQQWNSKSSSAARQPGRARRIRATTTEERRRTRIARGGNWRFRLSQPEIASARCWLGPFKRRLRHADRDVVGSGRNLLCLGVALFDR